LNKNANDAMPMTSEMSMMKCFGRREKWTHLKVAISMTRKNKIKILMRIPFSLIIRFIAHASIHRHYYNTTSMVFVVKNDDYLVKSDNVKGQSNKKSGQSALFLGMFQSNFQLFELGFQRFRK
jgi:hypothetical protein